MLVETRVPAALAARCEAVAERGGLGPPPPGALADDPPPVAPPATRNAPGAGRAGGRIGGGGGLFSDEDADEPDARWQRKGRSSSRLRGDELDRRIVNNDPERLRRQIMEQRRVVSGRTKAQPHTGKRVREEGEAAEAVQDDAEAVAAAAADAADDVAHAHAQQEPDRELVNETPLNQRRPYGLLSPDSTAGVSSEGALTEATGNGDAADDSADDEPGAAHRTRSVSAVSNPPSTLAACIGGSRRRAANGEATAPRPSGEEATPSAPAPPAQPPQRRGFAAAFDTFVARGICDSPSTSAHAPDTATGAAGMQEVASAAPAGEAATEGSEGDLMSPDSRGDCHRPLGEPASAGGSILGSTGMPEGKTASRRPASKVLASTTRPNLPDCGQPGSILAASAAKPARKSGGVTWADLPSSEGASPRRMEEVDYDSQQEPAAPFAGHTPFRPSRFARTPTTTEGPQACSSASPEGMQQTPMNTEELIESPAEEQAADITMPADVTAPELLTADAGPSQAPSAADHADAPQKRLVLPKHQEQAAALKGFVVERTEGFLLHALEEIHSLLSRCVRDKAQEADRSAVIEAAREAVAAFCDGING
ncbi:hypothetical protein COCSUDRAFT_56931 [Coccomyxa subellipsoidea C-169]|uniref:Uncharacterized protein n=1 Tax=Coccomyxa subellipsoidea (strain C-169) TaxID=574566 RepID=I0YRJ0_COCSC|nr:hypothetical protein COCSUDRAFT_56931 [Coccomyxa subellipsoidea C-169]EIE21009.1 hypothetical protein COCSUDRAFT_56931 [Coccomyxa subellipsoidea C-169]|eukprot:XP_005645553.1 hypothetical protein COCSUDRAFT_56931 [Coccomyxa subellipsoidea C-169]